MHHDEGRGDEDGHVDAGGDLPHAHGDADGDADGAGHRHDDGDADGDADGAGHRHDDGDAGGTGHRHDDGLPGGTGHRHDDGRRGLFSGLRPHTHDHAASVDDALLVSRHGTRALAISLVGLLVTAVVQLVVFAASGSVGLLADTTHNFADAFTALPIGLALVVARRPATRRYTYGYGRAEDLAGLAVVVVIAVSAAVAAWQSVDRLVHPQKVSNLALVAVAGMVGFVGNEVAAWYRVRAGRRIGSAALVADGHHARADGLTSLAVVAGAGGVAAGWRMADPVVGLAITVAILLVLRGAARDVYRRLMDAVDPGLVDLVSDQARRVPGVQGIETVRIRWIGHELHAELDVVVDADLSVAAGHDVAEAVHHRLLHEVRRLTNATVHVDPCPHAGVDPHRMTMHHRARGDAAHPG